MKGAVECKGKGGARGAEWGCELVRDALSLSDSVLAGRRLGRAALQGDGAVE